MRVQVVGQVGDSFEHVAAQAIVLSASVTCVVELHANDVVVKVFSNDTVEDVVARLRERLCIQNNEWLAREWKG